MKHPHPTIPLTDLGDPRPLLEHLVAGGPIDGEILGVVGDRQVGVSTLLGGLHHAVEILAAVTAERGVDVEITQQALL